MNRRFFLFDTLSGIENEGGFMANDPASIVRYAKNVTLKVTLDNNPDPSYTEMIYIPYVEIEYEEKQRELILESNDARMKRVTFMSEYFMDTSGFWKLCRTLFIILGCIIVIIVYCKIQVQQSAERMDTENAGAQ